MTVASDLLDMTRDVAGRIPIPSVRQLRVPPARPGAGIEGEFGLVVLRDGSAGFFFALLDDTLRRLQHAVQAADVAGRSPLALAGAIESGEPMERAVALGAICAVTQHVFRCAGFRPRSAANALGGGAFTDADHVGMVGLFPTLATRLRARGVRLTVLELNADKVARADRFEVTLDPCRLNACNTILCTASTLINGTLDSVLTQCRNAERIALIGPSASCFPDPLFRHGVHTVGGSAVEDADALLARLGRGAAWGDSVRRYAIDADHYPGTEALLGRIERSP